jgi:hypothetical protein
MSYDGSTWSYTPVGSLNLQDGQTGTMRAVYLPFGNGETVTADEGRFQFQQGYKSYYLTATLPYTVANHSISGNFRMSVPTGYVQFFVADAQAVNGGCTLSTFAVRPLEITGVASDMSLSLNSTFGQGGNLPGYAYQGGYLFSGVLADTYSYGSNYYFVKTVGTGSAQTRADFVATEKTLESHGSVNLPSATSTRWQPVGATETVCMDTMHGGIAYKCGTWYICNDGETVPEALTVSAVPYSTAKAAADATASLEKKKYLPTQLVLDRMLLHLTWFPMKVRGQEGIVAYASTGKFLFFPFRTNLQDSGLTPPYSAGYWCTSTKYLYVSASSQAVNTTLEGYQYYARYLSSLPTQ